MNYAKYNYFGGNSTARAKKTKTIARTAQRVYGLDAETQRCKRGAERPTKASACEDASDGFLKAVFLPVLQQSKTLQACGGGDNSKTESDFYTSLARLTMHYGIVPRVTRSFGFPYNMTLALWDLEQKLRKSVPNFSEVRAIQDSEKLYLLSEEKYSTGTTLYYIPVEPIYLMLRDYKHKKKALLLLSVCSYLYHSADIPYYRQEGSYLYWLYEMHRDWIEQEEDSAENPNGIQEFDKAELIGDCVEQKIFNRINLAVFEKRLNSFKSIDAFDNRILDIAQKAFGLYSQYPEQSIFRNAPIYNADEEEDTENESIRMEKFISFISHTKGWLYESLEESINNEFNQYGSMDEPTILKAFDGTQTQCSSLDFESRLFSLLEDLCELLNHYKEFENV